MKVLLMTCETQHDKRIAALHSTVVSWSSGPSASPRRSRAPTRRRRSAQPGRGRERMEGETAEEQPEEEEGAAKKWYCLR